MKHDILEEKCSRIFVSIQGSGLQPFEVFFASFLVNDTVGLAVVREIVETDPLVDCAEASHVGDRDGVLVAEDVVHLLQGESLRLRNLWQKCHYIDAEQR